jgi:uncharacterized sulfatase
MLRLLLFAFFTGAAFAADQPNVLFIVSDDLCTRLGCYGDPLVKTPNIDRLAARGVRFERAYCQFPLCNPSRASFLTGLRPDTLRVYELVTQFRKNAPDAQSVGQTFQKAGYYVGRVGKLYHYGVPAQIGTDGLDDPPTWQERFNPKGRDMDDVSLIEGITAVKGETARWKTGWKPNELGARLSRLPAEGADTEQTDGQIADQAIRMLEAHKAGPFFIATGFFRPHTPYVSPKKYFELYPPEKITLPATPAGHRTTVPPPAFTFKPDEEAMTDEQRREATQAYFAAVSFMDAQLGRVLDALDRLQLADKTIIVFTSDHGYHLYEHQLWQKMTLFENAARVPLIIVAPGGAKGAACARTVELVDLHQTLADLVGLPAPAGLEGRSLRPLVEKPDAPWDKPAITQVARRGPRPKDAPADSQPPITVMGYSLRTEKWRFTDWGSKGAELYDEEKDPGEVHNLASSPEHQETLEKLRGQLRKAAPGSGK